MSFESQLKDINVTPSEMKSLMESLEIKENREFLYDYMEEISNPEICRQYEEQISTAETQSGINRMNANLTDNLTSGHGNEEDCDENEEREKKPMEESLKKKEEAKKKEEEDKAKKIKEDEEDIAEYTTPSYTLKHLCRFDDPEFTNGLSTASTPMNSRPDTLIVDISLPLVVSPASVLLDIFEEKLALTSGKPANYKLELKLPYPVDEEEATAKFDKTKKRLTLTLPVLPAQAE